MGKFGNKLFAEAVNTEINCMQVKKKCLQKDGETKKLFVAGAAFKKMFAFKNVPIPSAPLSKNNGPSPSAIWDVHVCL